MTTEIRARMFEPIPQEVDALAASVVDAAFRVHKALGPGLLESVYETCLCHELNQRSIPFHSQVALPIHYNGLRLDLLIDNKLIVELKAVEKAAPLRCPTAHLPEAERSAAWPLDQL